MDGISYLGAMGNSTGKSGVGKDLLPVRQRLVCNSLSLYLLQWWGMEGNGLEWMEMVGNGGEWLGMVGNGWEWLGMLGNGWE